MLDTSIKLHSCEKIALHLDWPEVARFPLKISLSDLFNYFSVSGDSKQIKNSPQKSGTLTTTRGGGGRPFCGGHTPKVPLFFDAAPKQVIFPFPLWATNVSISTLRFGLIYSHNSRTETEITIYAFTPLASTAFR